MSEAIRTKIRQQIKPFQREVTYTTGWAGELSFEEIHKQLIPNMNRLLRYYRKPAAYIPDILQEGFMRLWWDLCEEPTMLADANKGDALRMVLDRTRTPAFVRRAYRREVYLEDLAIQSGDPDEFIIEGYEGRYFKDHSEFSRAIDIRVDFEFVIQHLVEKYKDSLPHLAALYYITTDVSVQAWWQTRIVKPIAAPHEQFFVSPAGERVISTFTSYFAIGYWQLVRSGVRNRLITLPKAKITYDRTNAHSLLYTTFNCNPVVNTTIETRDGRFISKGVERLKRTRR